MIKIPEIETDNSPVVMINLINFNDEKYYFETYVPAFEKAIKELGIEGVKLISAYKVIAPVVAPEGTTWDAVIIVQYPSAAAFKTMAESSTYNEIAGPHRLKATKELQLFMTQSIVF
jgi:uncharacterized protein (DUF1330 family)